MTTDFILGLDLGQQADPSALAVLLRSPAEPATLALLRARFERCVAALA